MCPCRMCPFYTKALRYSSVPHLVVFKFVVKMRCASGEQLMKEFFGLEPTGLQPTFFNLFFSYKNSFL